MPTTQESVLEDGTQASTESIVKNDNFKMVVKGDTLIDKDNAGAAILAACKEIKSSDSVEIGSYKGFSMHLSFSAFGSQHTLTLKGAMSHTTPIGGDARGNLVRIENALNAMLERLKSVTSQLEMNLSISLDTFYSNKSN